MKTCEGVEIVFQILLTSAPDGGVRSPTCSGGFITRKIGHNINWAESCLHPRASVDAVESNK
jgi:hypothetical protein